MKPLKILKNGILDENPTFVQVIGMCPTLAVTTSMVNGIGMGLSTMVVLVCSNLLISLLRKFIPDKVRIPAYVVVIASFVTLVEFMLKAYFPELNSSLGLYIPLIVVNCIILARAESYASKNGPIESLLDGIAMGLGFTIALICIGFVRELIGAGTIASGTSFAITIPEAFPRTLLFILPPGAFLTLGSLMALLNYFRNRAAGKADNK